MNRTIERFLWFLIALGISLSSLAQNPLQSRIDKIKSSPQQFKWGEGASANKEEANDKAIKNLISKIKLSAVESSKSEWSNNEKGDGYENHEGAFHLSSAASLQNTEEIAYLENDKWFVFRYVSINDLQKAINDRMDCEKDLISQGIEQEKNLNIAGALRYYNWALTMISHFEDNFKIGIDGNDIIAAIWLPNKISSILNNLSFSLEEGKLEYDPSPSNYDHYTVIVKAEYANNPVAALDLKYFNGQSTYSAHAKNGEIALKFPDLEGLNNIDFNICFAYEEEAKEVIGSSDLKAAYYAGGNVYKDVKLAYHSLPLKFNKGKLTALKKDNGKNVENTTSTQGMAVDPIVGKQRPVIERNIIADDKSYLEVMEAIEQAIRSKNYDSVKEFFTSEGFELFQMMTNKGILSVASRPKYSVERSELFTIGKGIPVSVKVGNHISKETLVFRFESDKPIIKSVAYALTNRAENDIFRKADWSLESRYSLLTFMEDYQTAFSIQNLAYIKKIFSNDALIITGKMVDDKRSQRFMDGDALNMTPRSNVVYKYQTKDQYMSHLENLFSKNTWTHLEFEENEISKANTGGLLDHEVMWIEIRQNWTSASGYNDTGVLALQINLKPSGSQINVRTWSPEFIPLDELKKRFPTDVKFQ